MWLHCLDISNNMLSGRFPNWMGKLSQLNNLWMMKNRIEGPLLHQLQNLTSLQVLDLSDNRFSGPIPTKVNFSSLLELSLQNNDFIGSIPDALFELSSLELLDLRNNNLVGKIPNSICKLYGIRVILLQKNHLEGQIPNEICQLRQVNFLDLSHNRLSGFIPSCLGNMSFGMSQDWGLEGNLGSNIITVFSEDVKVDDVYSSALELDGKFSFLLGSPTIVEFSTKQRYEHFQGFILQNMFGLDLSSNELSSDIPFQVGDLQNIRSLNLSHNRLTGSIPKSISKMENIESLDLSYNRLNGSIPVQLAGLSFLGYFSVSHNNLSGPIPFTGHLTTFINESTYIGNANLCGVPTSKSCDSTEVPNSSTTQLVKEEEDDGAVIDMVWFYWALGATYATVLLGLFAFLCIDSHWSRAWFYRVDLCIYHLQHFKRASILKTDVECLKRQAEKANTSSN